MTTKSKRLAYTDHDRYGRVVLTAGGIVKTMSGWRHIYGVFASSRDARCADADQLALATVGREDLTDEQAAIAERNTAALSD